MYGKMKEFLAKELADIKAAGLYKNERIITTPQRADIKVNDGEDVLNFCANNYLGLSDNQRLINAAKEAMDTHGFGMSSVRFICGTQDLHKQLEAAISDYFKTEDTILYAACFDANGIRQIEESTKLAVKNNFELNINENQEFVELSGLAHSINIILAKIREQITELENEIENKTKVENLRKQFVNNVSHEMKTPLAIISSQVEMLELLQDKQKKKEYCQSIMEETENMSQMINDMIVIYSMQSAEEELMVVSADINELVEFTCRDYDKLFFTKNISLHESYTEKCMAEVNERFFTQAVSNYITNAIKHCKEEGNVYVRVMSGENNIKVEVENDGKHIPEENIENIWNMFYQGNDSATLNGQKGSGLGLYLVKSIVELHHGKYGCENVENGVVFYIELPKVQKNN